MVLAILAHNLQNMAPFVDADHGWEVSQDNRIRPKSMLQPAMLMDDFRSNFVVPGDNDYIGR